MNACICKYIQKKKPITESTSESNSTDSTVLKVFSYVVLPTTIPALLERQHFGLEKTLMSY